MKNIAVIILFSISHISIAQNIDDKFKEILKESDFYRGSQISGISWILHVQNFKDKKQENELLLRIEVSTLDNKQFALITFLSPPNSVGKKMLLREQNLFFMKKGLRQPILISGRQRLSGVAANADITSCNYYSDYKILEVKETKYDGTDYWIFNLRANNNQANYYRIIYWIDKNKNQAMKAEFYGKSGKQIKTALFEYNNPVKYKSEGYNFISQISIFDNLNESHYTILDFKDIKFEEFDNSKFLKENLN
jgi:outer membrane lipoprotein-sorting protein